MASWRESKHRRGCMALLSPPSPMIDCHALQQAVRQRTQAAAAFAPQVTAELELIPPAQTAQELHDSINRCLVSACAHRFTSLKLRRKLTTALPNCGRRELSWRGPLRRTFATAQVFALYRRSFSCDVLLSSAGVLREPFTKLAGSANMPDGRTSQSN